MYEGLNAQKCVWRLICSSQGVFLQNVPDLRVYFDTFDNLYLILLLLLSFTIHVASPARSPGGILTNWLLWLSLTSTKRAKCLSRLEFNCKLLLNVKNRSKGDLKALCVRNSLRKKRDYVGSFSKMGVGGGLPPFPPLNINLPSNFCRAKLILRC